MTETPNLAWSLLRRGAAHAWQPSAQRDNENSGGDCPGRTFFWNNTDSARRPSEGGRGGRRVDEYDLRVIDGTPVLTQARIIEVRLCPALVFVKMMLANVGAVCVP